MAKRPELKGELRSLSVRKVKQRRTQSLIPANVFGKKVKSQAIQIAQSDFTKLYATAGETTLIDLKIEDEKASRAVLSANTQVHPVTSAVLHVDFHQVTLTEKVTANIPVRISR